jgi:regulation of enolase protein 1 (concanavalin A-like superfamily)
MNIRVLLATILGLLSSLLLRAADLPNWGAITSPLGDCTFKEKDGRLQIMVPGSERAHGLTAELQSMNAPRVLRPVKGDFTIQVKVDGNLDPGEDATEPNRTPYKASGLVVMLDDGNYVTLVRAALQRGNIARAYANFEIRVNGQCIQIGDARVRPFDLEKPAFLRLSREGNTIRGSVSDDGEKWDALPAREAPPNGDLISRPGSLRSAMRGASFRQDSLA